MPKVDAGSIGALFSLLVLVSGVFVVLATIKRTWTSQTINELKDLAEALTKRSDFQEQQLGLMASQIATLQSRLRDMEQDSLSLMRRNRELEERSRQKE